MSKKIIKSDNVLKRNLFQIKKTILAEFKNLTKSKKLKYY